MAAGSLETNNFSGDPRSGAVGEDLFSFGEKKGVMIIKKSVPPAEIVLDGLLKQGAEKRE